MFKRLADFVNTTLHPEIYHGRSISPPFFEGWYFKVVDSSGEHRYSFIPGVFLGTSIDNSHAFVQVLEGSSSGVEYHRYPIEQFWSADDHFEIRIAENTFSLNQIDLNINNHQQKIQGKLKFDNPVAETLSASIFVRLINKRTKIIEFEGTGDYAGLEVVGDMEKLIKMAIQ